MKIFLRSLCLYGTLHSYYFRFRELSICDYLVTMASYAEYLPQAKQVSLDYYVVYLFSLSFGFCSLLLLLRLILRWFLGWTSRNRQGYCSVRKRYPCCRWEPWLVQFSKALTGFLWSLNISWSGLKLLQNKCIMQWNTHNRIGVKCLIWRN